MNARNDSLPMDTFFNGLSTDRTATEPKNEFKRCYNVYYYMYYICMSFIKYTVLINFSMTWKKKKGTSVFAKEQNSGRNYELVKKK